MEVGYLSLESLCHKNGGVCVREERKSSNESNSKIILPFIEMG